MFFFYTPWKSQKTFSFLMFWVDIGHWAKIAKLKYITFEWKDQHFLLELYKSFLTYTPL